MEFAIISERQRYPTSFRKPDTEYESVSKEAGKGATKDKHLLPYSQKYGNTSFAG